MGLLLLLDLIVLASFLIICSICVSAMNGVGVVQEFGSILKRHGDVTSPMKHRPMISFYDSSGTLDTDSYLSYKRKCIRQEFLSPSTTLRSSFTQLKGSLYDLQITDTAPQKRRKLDKEIYDPEKARSSSWYRDYVLNQDKWINKKAKAKKFRRRFRMPMIAFQRFMMKLRTENYFPAAESVNALGHLGVPLEILVLGSLRYLGRGWTFDDLEEATGVHEETHRRFFHNFVSQCRHRLYKEFVRQPDTLAEIEDSQAEFEEAGFDGCIGSCDATHVIMERCPGKLKNQHIGGKLSQTARAYQITVNHRRRILSSTIGLPGKWNDKTVIRFDTFLTSIHRGELYGNILYELFSKGGRKVIVQGLWILVDGGYLRWSSTIPPFKHYANAGEERWSKWAESMRKDVECTFGILKGRFRILKTGIRLKGFETMDNIWFTCCALHNMLLEVDGLDRRWNNGIPSDYEEEFGQHDSISDVRNGLDAEVFSRLRNPLSYDTTSPVPNATYSENAIIVNNDFGQPTLRTDLSMTAMRDLLVYHFNYKWNRKEIRWPSRTGVTEMV